MGIMRETIPNMHNFHIGEPGFERPTGRKHRLLQRLAKLMKLDVEIVPLPDPLSQMTTREQRINLWHLAEQVLAYGVPGDFVDLGCFNGLTSSLLAQILAQRAPERRLHVYDSFEHRLGTMRDTRQALHEHFEARRLPEPVVHAGRFESTLPGELPAVIAFAQIDMGVGGLPEYHAALIESCLGHVWPRLAPGAVCVIQDYHHPENHVAPTDYYPFIKPTVDRFLTAHGARATAMLCGKYSHSFVRKSR